MRNLTVKRRKSFVGSIMSLKVYIEDREESELTICDIPCRMLGSLKNGEEKTFPVGDGAARVFVSVDKVSKDYCNDLFLLPEGEEDVSVSGVCKFNLGNGNAFRFDGKPSEEALQNRKKYSKKGTEIITAAIIIGVIVGFAVGFYIFTKLNAPSPKTFSSNGISVTVDTSFKEENDDTYLFSVYSKNVRIIATRDVISELAILDNMSLDGYAELIYDARDYADKSEITHSDGLTYFTYEYTNPSNDRTFTYFTSFYKTDSAFWIVQFMTYKESAEKYRPDIIKWASSVTFE